MPRAQVFSQRLSVLSKDTKNPNLPFQVTAFLQQKGATPMPVSTGLETKVLNSSGWYLDQYITLAKKKETSDTIPGKSLSESTATCNCDPFQHTNQSLDLPSGESPITSREVITKQPLKSKSRMLRHYNLEGCSNHTGTKQKPKVIHAYVSCTTERKAKPIWSGPPTHTCVIYTHYTLRCKIIPNMSLLKSQQQNSLKITSTM